MVHHRAICAGDADADDQTLLLSVQRLPPPCAAIGPYRRPELVVLHAAVLTPACCAQPVRGNAVSEKQSGSFFVGFFGSYFWR